MARSTVPTVAIPPLNDDEPWLTYEQVCELEPSLTPRTLMTMCEKRELRFGKRGTGKSAQRLFKISDVRAVIRTTVVEAECGPLAPAATL